MNLLHIHAKKTFSIQSSIIVTLQIGNNRVIKIVKICNIQTFYVKYLYGGKREDVIQTENEMLFRNYIKSTAFVYVKIDVFCGGNMTRFL